MKLENNSRRKCNSTLHETTHRANCKHASLPSPFAVIPQPSLPLFAFTTLAASLFAPSPSDWEIRDCWRYNQRHKALLCEPDDALACIMKTERPR